MGIVDFLKIENIVPKGNENKKEKHWLKVN